jgi:rhodanese-related sulfurtransferase
MKYPSPDQMVAQALKVVKTITVDELNKLMDSEEIYTLIDVRQKSEHYYGYIPGSLVIPRGSLEFLIGNEEYWETEGLYMPLKEETIIVYCKKGGRGALAANSLMQLGYDNVYTLDGGWKKWELTYPDFTEKNLDMLSGGNEEEHDIGAGC